MMAARAWPLRGELAGVRTAMITSRAVPALVPAHHRRVAISRHDSAGAPPPGPRASSDPQPQVAAREPVSAADPGYDGHLELQLRQCQLAYLNHGRRRQ